MERDRGLDRDLDRTQIRAYTGKMGTCKAGQKAPNADTYGVCTIFSPCSMFTSKCQPSTAECSSMAAYASSNLQHGEGAWCGDVPWCVCVCVRMRGVVEG